MSRARAERRRSERRPAAVATGGRRPGTRATPLLLAIAVALGAVIYLGALDGPFVYDDRMTVLGNPSIRDLGSPLALLLHDVFRPVVNLTYAVDFALWGLDPFGYHLTGLLLHLVNVGLLFMVALTLARDVGPPDDGDVVSSLGPSVVAFVAAAALAVHPMTTEAVAYVSGRSELLATLFVLLGVLLFRRAWAGGGSGWYLGGGVAFVLGAASKETAAMVPFMLLATDLLLGLGDPEARRRRLLRFHLPFAGLVLAGGMARVAVYLRLEQGDQMLGLWHHALTEVGVVWRYIALLLAPVGQSIMHPVETVTRLGDPAVLAAIAGLGAVVCSVLPLARRLPLVALGLVWFLLLLAPAHVVPLQEAMAEHRVYTASCGFFLAVGALAGQLVRRLENRGRPAIPIAAAVVVPVLTVLAVLTVTRTRVWADEVTLWQDAAHKAPRTWAAQYAHADALRMAGRCDEAVPVYRRAVELMPGQTAARLNLGICLAEVGRFEEARAVFEEVHRLDPTDPQPLTNLGTLAARTGDYRAAREHFLRAIELDVAAIPARMLLAQLAEAAFGDRRMALELCQEVANLAPQTPGVEECIRRNQEPFTDPLDP